MTHTLSPYPYTQWLTARKRYALSVTLVLGLHLLIMIAAHTPTHPHTPTLIPAHAFAQPLRLNLTSSAPQHQPTTIHTLATGPNPPTKASPPTSPKTDPTHKTTHLHPDSPAPPVIQASQITGKRVKPIYPKRALKMRQEGVVWVRVLLSKTGSIADITLHKPSPYALLNKAALTTVAQWTFDPYIKDESPIATWVNIPIEFVITR